jgi:AraC-like DNA-binding protein
MRREVGHFEFTRRSGGGNVAPGCSRWQRRGLVRPLSLAYGLYYGKAAGNLAEDVSLEDFSALAGIAVAHLCRVFKESTGTAPHHCRLAIRIQKSRELLKERSMTVAQFAMAVGFQTASHFVTIFRSEVG